MNSPCIDCPHIICPLYKADKPVKEDGSFYDLACGKYTAFLNYQAGAKEVVDWVEANTNIGISFLRKEWKEKRTELGLNKEVGNG